MSQPLCDATPSVRRTWTKGTGSMRPTIVLVKGVRFCCLLRPQSRSVHLRPRIPPSPFCECRKRALRGDKIFEMKMVGAGRLTRCCLQPYEAHSCVTCSPLERSILREFGLSTTP